MRRRFCADRLAAATILHSSLSIDTFRTRLVLLRLCSQVIVMRVCWRASGRATGVLLNGRMRGLAGGWTYGRAITSRQAHVRVIEWTVRRTDEQAGGRATARTGRHAYGWTAGRREIEKFRYFNAFRFDFDYRNRIEIESNSRLSKHHY